MLDTEKRRTMAKSYPTSCACLWTYADPSILFAILIFYPGSWKRFIIRNIITLPRHVSWSKLIFFSLALALLRALASSLARFHDHIQRRATVGRTPLNEWSVRRRDLYLTTHNTQHTNIQALGGIRTHDRCRRAAVDQRLRPRGHWDRHIYTQIDNILEF